MKLSKLISAAVLFPVITFGQCSNVASTYSFSYANHQYEVVRENQSWSNARACAAARGGYLLTIDDAAEQDAVFFQLRDSAGIIVANTIAPDGGGAPYVWIGGSDLSAEGSWTWEHSGLQFWTGETNGMPVGNLFSNWGTRNNREPDNFIDQQHALGLGLTDWPNGYEGEWNDIDPDNELYYVIEIPVATMVEALTKSAGAVFPNPTTGRIFVPGDADVKAIYVIDNIGRRLKSAFFQNSIDMSGFPDGVYAIRIERRDGFETQRVVLSR